MHTHNFYYYALLLFHKLYSYYTTEYDHGFSTAFFQVPTTFFTAEVFLVGTI